MDKLNNKIFLTTYIYYVKSREEKYIADFFKK